MVEGVIEQNGKITQKQKGVVLMIRDPLSIAVAKNFETWKKENRDLVRCAKEVLLGMRPSDIIKNGLVITFIFFCQKDISGDKSSPEKERLADIRREIAELRKQDFVFKKILMREIAILVNLSDKDICTTSRGKVIRFISRKDVFSYFVELGYAKNSVSEASKKMIWRHFGGIEGFGSPAGFAYCFREDSSREFDPELLMEKINELFLMRKKQ